MYSKITKINAISSMFGVVLILLAFLLVGCLPHSPISRNALITITPTMPIPKNTPTETHSTFTSTPESTSGLYDISTECIPVESRIPQTVKLRGGTFFYGGSEKYSNEIVLMNLSTKTIVNLEKNNFSITSLRVSPDGKWVAYFVTNNNNYSDRKLLVENIATGSVMDIPLSKEWGLFSLRKWLNNKDLLITTLENTDYPPIFIALNSFTEEMLTLPSVFPNQEVLSPITNVSVAEYDPTLNYVIYPAQKNDVNGFSLFDRAKNEQIVFSPAQTLAETGSPKWSHDGQKYLFLSKTKNSGAYNMGFLNGDVKILSYLPQEMTSFIVTSITWSPDDKYAAVVIYDVGTKLEKLILLDLARKKVVDTCIDVNYAKWSGAFSDSNSPVWSPDSYQLIVEKQSEYEKNDVILIDLSQMRAGILTHNERVLGWISLEP